MPILPFCFDERIQVFPQVLDSLSLGLSYHYCQRKCQNIYFALRASTPGILDNMATNLLKWSRIFFPCTYAQIQNALAQHKLNTCTNVQFNLILSENRYSLATNNRLTWQSSPSVPYFSSPSLFFFWKKSKKHSPLVPYPNSLSSNNWQIGFPCT